MNPFGRILAALVTTSAALAENPAPTPAAPPPEPKPSQFVFSLLPKSMQRHPRLDFHVITEMTTEGRKLPAATPEHPLYYLAQPGKFTQLGNNTPGNEHPPSVEALTRAIQGALTQNGYRPATPATPLPAIALVFNYGSFARFSTDAYDFQQMVALEQAYQDADPADGQPSFMPPANDRDADALLPMVLANPRDRSDVLKRADLIGGQAFARELADVLNQEASYRQGRSSLGAGGIDDVLSPFYKFKNTNSKVMTLIEESFSSCYFVIASAYDYRAMKQGGKVLLWRTKMTVNSAGISMTESLPELVLDAGPYFGRDMTESVTLTRRLSRDGRVELGTPRVIDYSEATSSVASPPSKSGK